MPARRCRAAGTAGCLSGPLLLALVLAVWLVGAGAGIHRGVVWLMG
jgi:hypothetical protein